MEKQFMYNQLFSHYIVAACSRFATDVILLYSIYICVCTYSVCIFQATMLYIRESLTTCQYHRYDIGANHNQIDTTST